MKNVFFCPVLMSSFISGFKKVIDFGVLHIEMPKTALQKSDVITFDCFYHCAAKNKYNALKVSIIVVVIKFYIPVI